MTVYQVSYDLNRPNQDYKGLWGELERFPNKRPLKSTWLIATQPTVSATAVFERLKGHIDGNDRMLVSEVTKNHNGWLEKDVWDWVNQNVA